MKKCIGNKFPSVIAGDTVKFKNTGDHYLVCYSPLNGAELMLVNLEIGSFWSRDSLWFGSNPEDWEKVNVCFKEIE